MHLRKIFCTFLFVISFSLLSGQEIPIVRQGKPMAEIVIGEKPTRSVQYSAYELQYVIRMMTGCELEIVTTHSGKKLPIFLGGAKDGEFFREAYSVSVTPEKIILKGHDSPDYGKVNYKNQRTYPQPEFNYHSTLYAVYDFLKYCAGVRFYGPGDSGICLKKRADLSVKPFERKYTPAEQGMRFIYTGGKDISYQLRMRCNKLYGYINHNAFSLAFRYWGKARNRENAFVEKRPWYFATYEGTPKYDFNINSLFDPKDPVPGQICMSQPDIINHFASEADAMYKGTLQPGTHLKIPKIDDCPYLYPFGEQDGAEWCQCKECKKKFPQVEPRFRYNYIHYDFANKLSREIKKRNQDINLIVFAYHQHLRYPNPEIVKLDPGIAICMVIQRDEWIAGGETCKWQTKAYQDWIQNESKNRMLFTWEHLLNPHNRARNVYKYKDFPCFYPRATAEFYKKHVKAGLQGCFLQVFYDFNPLEAYLIMRTIWDPDYDTDKVLDEYYEMMYAEAAAPMKAFFEENEKIVTNPANYPKTKAHLHSQEVNWFVGSPERMKKLDGYVQEALRSVKDPDAKKRLDLFMQNIWTPALQGRKDYDKRLSLEKNPLPSVGTSYIGPEAIPTEHDWAVTAGTQPWFDIPSSTRLSAKETPSVKLICNDKDLFLRYHEISEFGWWNRESSMWVNNTEFFFGTKGDYPFSQIAVSVKGKIYSCRMEERDGNAFPVNDRIHVTLLDNKLTETEWTYTIRIPMRDLDIRPGVPSCVNFIRTRNEGPKGKAVITSAAWSSITPNTRYADNLYRMGKLHVPPVTTEAKTVITESFQKIKRNGMPYSWTQSAPSLKKALCIMVQNGTVHVNAKNQDVHFPIRVYFR